MSAAESRVPGPKRVLAWAAVLLAISVPSSLFGMQAAVIAGFLCLLLESWRRRAWATSELDVPLSAWLVAIAVSLLLAPRPPTSLQTATSWWVWAAFFVVRHGLSDKRHLRWAMLGLMAAAGAASVLALVQGLGGLDPLSAWIHPQVETPLKPAPGAPGFYGAIGLFFSRLSLAHVLIFPIAWVFAWLLQPVGWRWRLALLALLVLLLGGLASTWTRAAPLALALVAGGLLLARLPRGWRRRLGLVAGLAILVLSGLLAGPHLPERLKNSFAGKHDWGRLTLWHSAQDLASENPMTGIGYGNFQRDAADAVELRRQQVGNRRFPGTLAWAHNLILSVTAECGLVGLLAFVWIFLAYFRAAHRRQAALPADEPWSGGLLQGSMGGVAGFLLIGLFHDPLWDGEVVFALLFAMGVSLSPALAARQPVSGPRPDLARDLGPLTLIGLAALGLMVFGSQAVLAWRSSATMAPGRLDFILPMAVAGGILLAAWPLMARTALRKLAWRGWLVLGLALASGWAAQFWQGAG